MKFSIITPSLNQCQFLKRTAHSILNQQGNFDLEWIIIDGQSTDGTLDFLKSLTDPRVRWLSETDNGQADAINKGLALATGDILSWLNSDDLYHPDALSKVSQAFQSHPEKNWLIGQCQIIDQNDKEIRPLITRYKNRQLARYSYQRLLIENFIPQPAVFWRRSFSSHSSFIIHHSSFLDESLHYTMDYDLWLRMGKAEDPLLLPTPIAQFRLHSQSKSGHFSRAQFDEGYQVAKRHTTDPAALRSHRRQMEKIILTYRLLRLVGI